MLKHPGVTTDQAQNLGELYDEARALFLGKHRLTQREIKEASWQQYGYQRFVQIEEKLEETSTQGNKLRRFCPCLLQDLRHFRTYLKGSCLPMTNNPAERALRNLVIARKLCFGTRSAYEKKWREAIHRCIETLHRKGGSVLDFLAETIAAYRLGQKTPSLNSRLTFNHTP